MTKTKWGHKQDLLGFFSLRSNAAAGPHLVLSLCLQEVKTDLKGTSFPEPFAALSSSPEKAPRLCATGPKERRSPSTEILVHVTLAY